MPLASGASVSAKAGKIYGDMTLQDAAQGNLKRGRKCVSMADVLGGVRLVLEGVV